MTISRRDMLRGAGGLAAGLALPYRSWADATDHIEGYAFGTKWRLTVLGSDRSSRIGTRVASQLEALEDQLSPFRPNSDIAAFNSSEGRVSAPLSRPAVDLVRESLAIARWTGGAFDPTLGPAVARYGFGPIRSKARTTAQLAIGYRGLRLEAGRLARDTAGLTFDPCGSGKGHALDAIGRALRAKGFGDFLFEFGGDIIAAGDTRAGRSWRVGIENPLTASVSPYAVVALKDAAIATSGVRVNSYTIGGRRYCHIIDPATGEPVDNALVSVTVIAASGVRADALATALMAMGPQRGRAFAHAHMLPVLFIEKSGVGLISSMAGGFETFIVT